MALFENVQSITFIGSTLNNVSGNQLIASEYHPASIHGLRFSSLPSSEDNIAGPSIGNAPTIPAITSVGSSTDVPVPPVNKKPPRLTTMFTGRRDILQQLAQYFSRSKSSMALKIQKIFVLYGLGGAGKTATMMKFVDECSDRFGDVHYVDASTLATLQAGLESIARNASAGQTVDDALRWLSQQRNEWLLSLDNADDPSINLRNFFPHCTHEELSIKTKANLKEVMGKAVATTGGGV